MTDLQKSQNMAKSKRDVAIDIRLAGETSDVPGKPVFSMYKKMLAGAAVLALGGAGLILATQTTSLGSHNRRQLCSWCCGESSAAEEPTTHTDAFPSEVSPEWFEEFGNASLIEVYNDTAGMKIRAQNIGEKNPEMIQRKVIAEHHQVEEDLFVKKTHKLYNDGFNGEGNLLPDLNEPFPRIDQDKGLNTILEWVQQVDAYTCPWPLKAKGVTVIKDMVKTAIAEEEHLTVQQNINDVMKCGSVVINGETYSKQEFAQSIIKAFTTRVNELSRKNGSFLLDARRIKTASIDTGMIEMKLTSDQKVLDWLVNIFVELCYQQRHGEVWGNGGDPMSPFIVIGYAVGCFFNVIQLKRNTMIIFNPEMTQAPFSKKPYVFLAVLRMVERKLRERKGIDLNIEVSPTAAVQMQDYDFSKLKLQLMILSSHTGNTEEEIKSAINGLGKDVTQEKILELFKSSFRGEEPMFGDLENCGGLWHFHAMKIAQELSKQA